MQVEQESENGGEGTSYGERSDGFVKATDHDASFVMPAAHDAAVAERPG